MEIVLEIAPPLYNRNNQADFTLPTTQQHVSPGHAPSPIVPNANLPLLTYAQPLPLAYFPYRITLDPPQEYKKRLAFCLLLASRGVAGLLARVHLNQIQTDNTNHPDDCHNNGEAVEVFFHYGGSGEVGLDAAAE